MVEESIGIEERLMNIEMKVDALTRMVESKLRDIEHQFGKLSEIEEAIKDTRSMTDELRKVA